MQGPRKRLIRGWKSAGALVLAVVVAACVVGLLAFASDTTSRHGVFTTGSDAPDRVEIRASVQHVNATSTDLNLRVIVEPRGSYSELPGDLYPSQDISVETTSLAKSTLEFPAHHRVIAQDLLIGLDKGDIADYPFDLYETGVYFSASVAGKAAPIRLELVDADPFFTTKGAVAATEDPLIQGFELDIRRTRATFVMVWLMFAVMWGLALSVATGSLLIARTRKGIPWPALGWTAATLFALAGFRNTAPGSPPIGCLLDYTAFLWSEAIVAFSVVYVIARGTPVELKPAAS